MSATVTRQYTSHVSLHFLLTSDSRRQTDSLAQERGRFREVGEGYGVELAQEGRPRPVERVGQWAGAAEVAGAGVGAHAGSQREVGLERADHVPRPDVPC